MALGNLAPTHDVWSRWSHPHPHPHPQAAPANFHMMDINMAYDCCRPAPPAPIPRPELAQHFHSGPFSPAQMPSPVSPPQYQPPSPVSPHQYHAASPVSPQYQAPSPVSSHYETPSPVTPHYQAPMPYGGYNPYGTPPLLDAPFKPQECVDTFVKRSSSPSIKCEARSPGSDGSFTPKTLNHGTPEQEAPAHQFNTAIDNIVRVLEAKREMIGSSEVAEPTETSKKKPAGKKNQVERPRSRTKRKRFYCEIDGCTKVFPQRNNLETHLRSHTGERPYKCEYCNRGFTQSVNLESHKNRHTGLRPYKCSQCPKTFPQPSNVRSHEKTHVARDKRAHWVCKFGKCTKTFTEKGNLKSHQNSYHVDEIETFKARIASVQDKSSLSPADLEMASYIMTVHNLANKGIKGRGKGRKVDRVVALPTPPTISLLANPYPMAAPYQQQQQQGHPFYPAYGAPTTVTADVYGQVHHQGQLLMGFKPQQQPFQRLTVVDGGGGEGYGADGGLAFGERMY